MSEIPKSVVARCEHVSGPSPATHTADAKVDGVIEDEPGYPDLPWRMTLDGEFTAVELRAIADYCDGRTSGDPPPRSSVAKVEEQAKEIDRLRHIISIDGHAVESERLRGILERAVTLLDDYHEGGVNQSSLLVALEKVLRSAEP